MAFLARSNASKPIKKNRNLANLQLPASVIGASALINNSDNESMGTPEPGSSISAAFASASLKNYAIVLNGDDMLSPDVAAVGELKPEDVVELGRLGQGSAGTVKKCRHEPTGTIMAKKIVPVDPNPDIQKQIVRELKALRRCNSPYIVSYYGAYVEDGNVAICMEYCRGGSLENIYKRVRDRHGRVGEGVLGKIAHATLEALVYLHQQRIIHRDVKPSNILVNEAGQIKVCDFGVSGELVDSLAQTFTGTSYYMAPERIKGGGYNVRSDVWSLGLTILEIAQNQFPLLTPTQMNLAPFELLDLIVNSPVPELSESEGWSHELRDFVHCCLIKDPAFRPTPAQMLHHPFVQRWAQVEVDLARWVREVWS